MKHIKGRRIKKAWRMNHLKNTHDLHDNMVGKTKIKMSKKGRKVEQGEINA